MSTSSPARDAERRGAGGTVLDAVLERITYLNEETGYTIARVVRFAFFGHEETGALSGSRTHCRPRDLDF